MKRYSPEDDSVIRTYYPAEGLIGCASRLNRAKGSIQARVKVLKLPPLDKETKIRLASKNRKNLSFTDKTRVNSQQFIDVKTKEAAYLLGLIWADGYVNDEKVTITCLLSDAKEYMPTFFKTGKWRWSDYSLKRYGVKMKPSRTIRIGNVRLARYLLSRGYGAKSKQSAKNILSTFPLEMLPFWFRGLVDGDGYISYSKKGMFWIKITSDFDQDWTHMEEICQKLDIKYKIDRDRYINKHGKENSRSVFKINNAHGVKTFGEYIYQGRGFDNIGLTRKYLKWKDMMIFMKSRPRVRHLFELSAPSIGLAG